MKRILKKILAICICVLLFAGVYYILAKKPLYNAKVHLHVLEDWPSSPTTREIEESSMEDIRIGKSTGILIRTDTIPEEWDNNQYITVFVDVSGKNITPFKLRNLTGRIEKKNPDSRLLFSDNMVVPENIKAFKNDEAGVLVLEMYKGDMTYDEVLDYFKDYELVMTYSISIFGRCETRISFENVVLDKLFQAKNGELVDVLEEE